jgi:hypothetical protein
VERADDRFKIRAQKISNPYILRFIYAFDLENATVLQYHFRKRNTDKQRIIKISFNQAKNHVFK